MTDPSLMNAKSWQPIVPVIFNKEDNRSAQNYIACGQQFGVADNPRYVPGHDNDPSNGRETYCNIFLWDFTTAMSCEIPHWVDPATGAPTGMGKGKEQSANTVCDWMTVHAFDFGWMQCSELKARDRASKGFPTVVVWKNSAGIGHVAVVLPGTDFTHVAQAGGVNFFDKDIRIGFGGVKPLMFYTHD